MVSLSCLARDVQQSKRRLIAEPFSEPLIVPGQSNVSLRRGSLNNLNQLLPIIRRDIPIKSQLTMNEVHARCADGYTLVVAERGGIQIGGMIMLHQNNSAYIWLGICTDKGKGIGKFMLNQLLKTAFVSGFSVISAKTHIDNAATLNLLWKNGFSLVDNLRGVCTLERPLTLNLASNTLPFTPLCIREAMAKIAGMQLCEYVDLGEAIMSRIAAVENVSVENIKLVPNGTDAIEALLSLAAEEEVVFLHPTFEQIENGIRKRARSLIPIHADSLIGNFIDECTGKLAFLCNPNNPTGSLLTPDCIIRIAKVAKLLIIDEAYMHFANESAASLVQHHPVIILKTISKFGSAVAQLGYVIGPQMILAKLPVRSEANPVGMLAALAIFSENGQKEMKSITATVNGERERLAKELVSLDYEVPPSRANFLLVPEKNGEAKKLALLGITVKSVNIDEKSFMRITVRNEWENDLLILALRELH